MSFLNNQQKSEEITREDNNLEENNQSQDHDKTCFAPKVYQLGAVKLGLEKQIFRVKVYRKLSPGQQPVELGECQVDIQNIFSAKEQSIQFFMQLKLGTSTNSNSHSNVSLKFILRFLPDLLQLNSEHDDYNKYNLQTKSPEGQIHYQTVNNVDLFDEFNFQVPLQKFNRFDFNSKELETSQLPQILKNKGSIEVNSSKLSLNLGLGMSNRIMQSLHQSFNANRFMSYEQALDQFLYDLPKDFKKLRFQDFAQNHQSHWQAHQQMVVSKYLKEIAEGYWSHFLEQMQHQKSLQFSEDDACSIEYGKPDRLRQTINAIHQRVGQNKIGIKKLFNHDLKFLIFANKWQESSNSQEFQMYKDLFSLVHNHGFQPTQRHMLWRDIMKAQLIELEEIRYYKSKPGQTYNINRTIFQQFEDKIEGFDSTSFRQVDQDMHSFQFPTGYLQNLPIQQQKQQKLLDKFAIRRVLRMLIFWSTHKEKNEKFTVCYSQGTMEIIHKIISTSQRPFEERAEEAFWILVGLIKMYPRCFTIDQSILTEDSKNMMRYEIITLKAIVKQNLPDVYTKLKTIGLPLEQLIYHPIMSLYANYMSTAVVLRLWDLIFFSFSSYESELCKHGRWYIMAPAFIVLQKAQKAILDADTTMKIIFAYKSGFSDFYSEDKFIKELDRCVKKLFIEEIENNNQTTPRSIISAITGGQASNRQAIAMENLRYEFQGKTDTFFKRVEQENHLIERYFSDIHYLELSRHFNSQFQRKQAEQFEDLGLTRVHVMFDTITRIWVQDLKNIRLEIQYGKLRDRSGTLMIENQQLQKQSSLKQYEVFKYAKSINQLKIRIFNKSSQEEIASSFIDLSKIERGKFTKHRAYIQLKNRNEDSWKFAYGQLMCIFYLEKSSSNALKAQSQDKQLNYDVQTILRSFVRKNPDFPDFFRIQNPQNTMLKTQFEQFVVYEYQLLLKVMKLQNASDFQSNQSADQVAEFVTDVIEDMYNYVEFSKGSATQRGDQEHDSRDVRLRQMARTLPSQHQSKNDLATFYDQMTMSVKRQGLTPGETPGSPQSVIDLRSFVVGVILESQSTLKEKFDLMIDMYFRAEQFLTFNQMRLQYVYQLIQTIYLRCKFFMPQIEVINMCEFVFQGTVNMIKRAVFTSIRNTEASNHKVEDFLRNQDFEDVTTAVRERFSHFFVTYGTKQIDFNQDGPFKTLADLVGKDLSYRLTSKIDGLGLIMLMLQKNNESTQFNLYYDSQGAIVRCGDQNDTPNTNITKISEYFQRDAARLDMSGFDILISREEFYAKLYKIPMLAQLVRAQTLCKFVNNKVKNVEFVQNVVVGLIIGETHLRFSFQSSQQGNDYKDGMLFKMKQLFKSNLLVEVRQKIKLAYAQANDWSQEVQDALDGGFQWFFYTQNKDGQYHWKEVDDFQRIDSIIDSNAARKCQIFKLDRPHGDYERNSKIYDCHGLYIHADQSYEWRPCRIVQRLNNKSRAIVEYFNKKPNVGKDPLEFQKLKTIYRIEFEHLRHHGEAFQCERKYTEIAFSKEQIRYQTPKFQKINKNYLQKLYN